MKNLFKFLTLGMMTIALIGAATISSFAQDECETIYKKWTENFRGDRNNVDNDISMKQTAIAGGKEFLGKCDNADQVEIATYLKKQVPILENKVKDIIMYNRFNKSIPAKNWDEAFASGKEIIAKYPDTSLDIILVLASIGFDSAAAVPPVDKFNNDTINMANMAIQQISAGKTSGSGKYGAFGTYEYTTTAFPDGKNNALGWMNYTIGYINYYNLKNHKNALPYFYKATQINSATKTFPEIFRGIGAWYLDEFNRIGTDRDAKTKLAGDKDTEETLQLLALQKGYAERAADAYNRAYKLALPKDAKSAASYLNLVKTFYKFRFDMKPEDEVKNDDFNKYTADLSAKPFPDPTSVVTPIVDAPTTATTTTPTPGTGTTVTTPTTATPGKTTTTAPGKTTTTTTTAPGKTTTTTTTTTPTTPTGTKVTTPKKPTTKKKAGK